MKSRTKLYIAAAVIFFGIANIGYTLYGAVIADTSNSSKEVASSTLAAAAVAEMEKTNTAFPEMADPAKLNIPSLGVNADIIQVGVTATGNMAVPHSFQQVGWYKYGPAPGNDGDAVLAGHVDNGLSLAGVFYHLKDIKIGDTFEIVDSASGTAVFEVTATSSLDYHEGDTSAIFTTEGPPTLTLITCTGDWVQADKTYDHRLIVKAKRIR